MSICKIKLKTLCVFVLSLDKLTFNFRLAKFVDTFGSRPSGSMVLEDSIDYMIDLTKNENLYNVVTEDVEVSE